MYHVFELWFLCTTQYKMVKEWFILQKVSGYDQEIPQSQTADPPTAPYVSHRCLQYQDI